jgi:N6-adenosine-specific RNA methylase IME4
MMKWPKSSHARGLLDVLDAWGFEQKNHTHLGKGRLGCGDWLRGQTEHCLIGVRGAPIVTLTNESTLLSPASRAE